MPKSKKESEKPKDGESTGLEAKLWAAADALRNNMDAAEYKHVVLAGCGKTLASPYLLGLINRNN